MISNSREYLALVVGKSVNYKLGNILHDLNIWIEMQSVDVVWNWVADPENILRILCIDLLEYFLESPWRQVTVVVTPKACSFIGITWIATIWSAAEYFFAIAGLAGRIVEIHMNITQHDDFDKFILVSWWHIIVKLVDIVSTLILVWLCSHEPIGPCVWVDFLPKFSIAHSENEGAHCGWIKNSLSDLG